MIHQESCHAHLFEAFFYRSCARAKYQIGWNVVIRDDCVRKTAFERHCCGLLECVEWNRRGTPRSAFGHLLTCSTEQGHEARVRVRVGTSSFNVFSGGVGLAAGASDIVVSFRVTFCAYADRADLTTE